MYRMLNFTDLSKAEADKLCDEAGIVRKEVNHASRGWSYTSLKFNDQLCGEITPRKIGQPFTLAIDIDRIGLGTLKLLLERSCL